MVQIFIGPKYSERKQFKSSFAQKMLNKEQDSSKVAARNKIKDFILKYHNDSKIRLMSLPGIGWDIEHLLYKERQDIEFLALERNFSILKQSLYNMPGGTVTERQFPIKDNAISYYKTDIAKIAWLDSREFVSIGRDKLLNKSNRKKWRNEWRKWTAIVWDFNSNINDGTLHTLRQTCYNTDKNQKTVPIAINLLKSRELEPYNKFIQQMPGNSDKRCEFLESWYNTGGNLHRSNNRTLEIKDHFAYYSQNKVPMLVILGLLHDNS